MADDLENVSDAVVAAIAALGSQSQSAKWHVETIKNDNCVLRIHFEVLCKGFVSVATIVHKCLRLHQYDGLLTELPFYIMSISNISQFISIHFSAG